MLRETLRDMHFGVRREIEMAKYVTEDYIATIVLFCRATISSFFVLTHQPEIFSTLFNHQLQHPQVLGCQLLRVRVCWQRASCLCKDEPVFPGAQLGAGICHKCFTISVLLDYMMVLWV